MSAKTLSGNPLLIKREIRNVLAVAFSVSMSDGQYKRRTARELLAILKDEAAKANRILPSHYEEEVAKIRYKNTGESMAAPEAVVNPVALTEAVSEIVGDILLHDRAVSAGAHVPPEMTEEERKAAKKAAAKLKNVQKGNTKALRDLGLYKPRTVLVFRTLSCKVSWRYYSQRTRQKETLNVGSLTEAKFLTDSVFAYDFATVATSTSGFTSMDLLQEQLEVPKTKAGDTEVVSIQQVLAAPKVVTVPGEDEDDRPTKIVALVPLQGAEQRAASIVTRTANLGYAIFGGSGGGVKAAYRIGKDGTKLGTVYRRIVTALSKGVEWAGYLSKFNATVHETFTDVSVDYYDATKSVGEDGSSRGWNPDHPGNAAILAEHGPSVLQFFYGNVEGVYGKGLLVPINLGANGPQFRLAHNAVKGRMKNEIKKECMAGTPRTDTKGNFLGILRASDHHKTQQLGFQWLLHCANTAENRAIVKEAAEVAARKVVSAGVEGAIKAVCAQDATAEVSRQWALRLDKSPMTVPVIQKRVQARLKRQLFESFGSLGIEGQIFEVLMDNRVKRGTYSCSRYSDDATTTEPKIGESTAVWRTPHMHWQGNLLLTRVPWRKDQLVVVNGKSVQMRGVIAMHPEDVAKINGDDDGDTVGISCDPVVVELAKNHHRYHDSDAIWAFEPESHATGKEFPEPEAYRDARYRDQGPVGLAVNWQAETLGIRDIAGKKFWPTALAGIAQPCVDLLKKDVSLPSFDLLATEAAWGSREAAKGGYPTRTAPKATDKAEADPDKGIWAPRSVAKALSEATEAIITLKKEYGVTVQGRMVKAKLAEEEEILAEIMASTPPEKLAGVLQRVKREFHGQWSHKKDNAGKYHPQYPKEWQKLAKRARGWGQVDFAAWKWHGPAAKKGEVNPLGWLPCAEKDGGYQSLRNSNPRIAYSPSLVHHAHDAAQAVWVTEGAALIDQLRLMETEGFVSFAKVFKDVATTIDDAGALPPSKEDAKKWWSIPPTTLMPLYKRGNDGKLVVDMRGSSENMTQLEREFEVEVTKLADAMRTQAEHTSTLGGDDDNGRGLNDASNGFKRWVLAMKDRGDKRGPRPLTAKECLYLAVYHELGAIVHGNFLPDPIKAAAKARKRAISRQISAWSFVFAGSPLAEALGCRVEECDALNAAHVSQSMKVYQDEVTAAGEGFVPHEWLGFAKNRECVIDDLDALHESKAGCSLVSCKVCTLRVKMSLADFMVDRDRESALIAIANKLNEGLHERAYLYSNVVDYSQGSAQAFILPPEPLSRVLGELGMKVEFRENSQTTARNGGLRAMYPVFEPVKAKEQISYEDLSFDCRNEADDDSGTQVDIDDLI